MSESTIDNIFDFILTNSTKFQNIYVEFIGGEPLLKLEEIGKILHHKNIPSNVKFQITTNGIIIDDYVYNNFIANIDKVNLSFNENYFVNNSLFIEKSQKILNKGNININFIYDPRKNLEEIKKNFIFIIKQGYTSISILPIVLVYMYSKKDFMHLLSFLNFAMKYHKIIKLDFIYYIQEKNNDFEFTINPDGQVLGDNMGTAESFFGIDNKTNKTLGFIGDLTVEDIYNKLQDYSYIKYLKNITFTGKTAQDYNNLLFLSNLLKKYNDKISLRDRTH